MKLRHFFLSRPLFRSRRGQRLPSLSHVPPSSLPRRLLPSSAPSSETQRCRSPHQVSSWPQNACESNLRQARTSSSKSTFSSSSSNGPSEEEKKTQPQPRPPSSTTPPKNQKTKRNRLPHHRRRPLLPRRLRAQVCAGSGTPPQLRSPTGLRAAAGDASDRIWRAASISDAAAPRIRRAPTGADGASTGAATKGERVPDLAAELRVLLPVLRDVLQLKRQGIFFLSPSCFPLFRSLPALFESSILPQQK